MPVIELNGLPGRFPRPHWPRVTCECCGKATAMHYLPLDMLGKSWWAMVPDKNPSSSFIALCKQCFGVARTREGRIMGYSTRNGKTIQHVVEEVFGGETAEI